MGLFGDRPVVPDRIYQTPTLFATTWSVTPAGISDRYNFTIRSLTKDVRKRITAELLTTGQPIYRNHSITVYDSNPVLTRNPQNNLKDGDKFELTCTFGKWGHGIFTGDFYVDNETISGGSADFKVESDKIIFSANFTADYKVDRKDITCRVFSKDQGFPNYIASNTIRFEVEHKVTQIKISPDPSQSDITVKSGDTINCTASGNPPPDFEWRRKDESESPKQGKTLTVASNWENGERTYICTAKNVINQQLYTQNASITFKIDNAGTSSGSKSGTEAWKIAVATVGAILGVALIVGIIVIVLVLRKRGRKHISSNLSLSKSKQAFSLTEQPKPPIRSDASRSQNNANDNNELPTQRKPDNRVPADIPRSVGPSVGPPDSTPLYSELQRPKRPSAYDNLPPSAYQTHNVPSSRAPYMQGDFDDSLTSSNGPPPELSQAPRYIMPSGPQPRPSRPLRPNSGTGPTTMAPGYNNYSPDTQV
ncbi:DgyrCDS9430 [Dimorphilus gyrociliatus]|uniref:DgyrCDS9430 n=1 Tax=Dimorphilus gyrociliatus TaxID=2664684 RepID=A0A7I8VWZ6_9ANNE|nr:DgyrCDS9430 [Dimorphilus gyrociliatus]